MKIGVEYGRGVIEVEIPRKRFRGVIEPHPVKPVRDLRTAVRRALARPVESPPLREILHGASTALIVTVDHTRPSPRPMLEPILEQCRRENVVPTICIATGRHRQMTPEELRRHFGTKILRAYRVIQHDPFNRRIHRRLGKTRRGTEILVNQEIFKHDRVLGVGIIEPSYLAGWSGGRKLLMPGLSYHTSVDSNHFHLTDPTTRIGVLHGNALSDDAAEFARKCPMHFICYSVNGPADEVVGVVAGHPVKAHELACRCAERIYKVSAKPAPIIISSAGGWPYDCDLVQGKKAIIPAIDLVERNGVIILLAECRSGLGAEEAFTRWLRTKTPAEVVRDVKDRKQFNLGAHGANILARPIAEKNATVLLVTCPEIVRQLRGTYVRAFTRFSEAWDLANALCGRDAGVLVARKARRLICRVKKTSGGVA